VWLAQSDRIEFGSKSDFRLERYEQTKTTKSTLKKCYFAKSRVSIGLIFFSSKVMLGLLRQKLDSDANGSLIVTSLTQWVPIVIESLLNRTWLVSHLKT